MQCIHSDFLCTWLRRHKVLCPGCRVMECSNDILDAEPSHDQNPRQPHRLPAPVPRRRRRPVARRRPMATHSNGISALQLQKRLGIGSCSAKDLGNFAVRNTAAIVKTGPPVKFSPGSTPRSPTSRAARQAPPDLSRRVRLSLQPAPKSPRRIPVPVPAGSARQTSPLLHLDQTGTTCISSCFQITARKPADAAPRPESRPDRGAFGDDARTEEETGPFVERVERKIGPIRVAVYNVGANVRFPRPRRACSARCGRWRVMAGFCSAARRHGTILFAGAAASGRWQVILPQPVLWRCPSRSLLKNILHGFLRPPAASARIGSLPSARSSSAAKPNGRSRRIGLSLQIDHHGYRAQTRQSRMQRSASTPFRAKPPGPRVHSNAPNKRPIDCKRAAQAGEPE